MKNIVFSIMFVVFLTSVSSIASDNLLGSSEFSKKNKWNAWAPKKMHAAGLKTSFKDGTFEADIPELEGKKHSFLQFLKNIKLENGKRYKLTVDISSDQNITIPISYIINKKPYSSYAYMKTKLKKGNNHIVKEFTVKAEPTTDIPRSLRFYLGQITGKVKLSNIILQEVK